jgi:hypothetical protein
MEIQAAGNRGILSATFFYCGRGKLKALEPCQSFKLWQGCAPAIQLFPTAVLFFIFMFQK